MIEKRIINKLEPPKNKSTILLRDQQRTIQPGVRAAGGPQPRGDIVFPRPARKGWEKLPDGSHSARFFEGADKYLSCPTLVESQELSRLLVEDLPAVLQAYQDLRQVAALRSSGAPGSMILSEPYTKKAGFDLTR